MIHLAADENFNNDIVRGILRRNSTIDADDPTVLEWAALNGRVLLTHDVATITHYAYERIRAGQAMPGVFEVSRTVPLSQAIDEIILMAECSLEGEWDNQVRYLPLR